MPGKSMLRMTRQRQVILDAIREVRTHPTADEVHQMVRRYLPRISLATVYRNLEALSERGLLQKLELAGTQRRFDGNTHKHYHVRCIRCGRTDDLPLAPLGGLHSRAEEASGYEVRDHRLEFLGLCPGCREKGRPRTSA